VVTFPWKSQPATSLNGSSPRCASRFENAPRSDVPHAQKGAVLIEYGHKLATSLIASTLALGLIFASSAASAAEKSPFAPSLAPEATYWTGASPNADFLGKKTYTQRESRPVRKSVPLRTILVDAARTRLAAAAHAAGSALKMIATAYTAGCYGCSGITATGTRAGHGIVAVDPRVIPLGTHLYVPGYGKAIAGDTGGAIKGLRIDLGFDSLADAIRFGRREITVYVLR
jgi:3D (Asp-Asp-Asp) domain-containing protein